MNIWNVPEKILPPDMGSIPQIVILLVLLFALIFGPMLRYLINKKFYWIGILIIAFLLFALAFNIFPALVETLGLAITGP